MLFLQQVHEVKANYLPYRMFLLSNTLMNIVEEDMQSTLELLKK
jgi:hypothetical protein